MKPGCLTAQPLLLVILSSPKTKVNLHVLRLGCVWGAAVAPIHNPQSSKHTCLGQTYIARGSCCWSSCRSTYGLRMHVTGLGHMCTQLVLLFIMHTHNEATATCAEGQVVCGGAAAAVDHHPDAQCECLDRPAGALGGAHSLPGIHAPGTEDIAVLRLPTLWTPPARPSWYSLPPDFVFHCSLAGPCSPDMVLAALQFNCTRAVPLPAALRVICLLFWCSHCNLACPCLPLLVLPAPHSSLQCA